MVYFVSGHRDLTQEEFDLHYKPVIRKVTKETLPVSFVIGDCEGADRMAAEYICDFSSSDIHIYHIFTDPRFRVIPFCDNEAEHNIFYHGGYQSDMERDTAMTEASDFDIAYIRPGRKKSGTAQNILRRITKIK